MDYKEAVDRIMENREVEALLSRNEIMTISVAGKMKYSPQKFYLI